MLDKLKQIAKNAYVPYSNFHVAALFELSDNMTFSGFNIENAAYPNSLCAERVAIVSAINNGIDLSKVKRIHIYSPDSKNFLSPCGGCRQTMSEFLKKDVKIYMYDAKGNFVVKLFSEILPYPVEPENIQGRN